MNKLLGNTMTWKEVLQRFTSPVIIVGFIVLLLNFARAQFGWQIPIDWIEMILNFIIYGGTSAAMAVNDATNKNGL